MENIGPHKNGKFVKVHTNSGTQFSSMVENYPRLNIIVWFDKDFLANILSLATVRKLYHVTVDTAQETIMHVPVSKTGITAFIEIPNGL